MTPCAASAPGLNGRAVIRAFRHVRSCWSGDRSAAVHGCGRRPRGARFRGSSALLLAVGLAACDIPTSLPRFEAQFGIPMDATKFSVAEFLPAGVTATASAFQVVLDSAASHRTLGQMCAACAGSDGMQVPKPAYTDEFPVSVTLPHDVVGAELVSATATVRVSHDLGFDPVRPAGSTQGGMVRVVLVSGGRELGRDSITGTFTQPVTRNIAIPPGPVTGTIVAEVTIISPAGDPVTIDNSRSMSVYVTFGTVAASQVHVQVQDRQVASEAMTVDLTDVDPDVRGRAQRATLVLDVENPLAVAGTFELRLFAPGSVEVRRTVQIGAGASSLRIELAQEEIRGLLGQMVDVSLMGTANGTAGPVTLRPTDAVTIAARLNLVLEIGS